jgi:hypothetical protein
MKVNVRLIYLYLFSFIGLLVVVIGSIRMVDLGIKTVFFKDADKYEYYSGPETKGMEPVDEAKIRENAERDQARNRQRELSNSVAMILVGAPLYFYHWRTIQKENTDTKEKK